MIDYYRFGVMSINGEQYHKDLIIKEGAAIPNWWRKEGHRLHLDDLTPHLTKQYDLIIIGTGAYGAMIVPSETKMQLNSKAHRLIVDKTDKAAVLYNEHEGKNILAAFHLTC